MSNFLNNEFKEILNNNNNNKSKDLRKIMLNKEFLQLYFMNLGANPSLTVDNYTDIYDMISKRNKEKFCFAIIKTKDVEKYENSEYDKTLDDYNLKSFYPMDDLNIDKSIKFLLLAYSGFLNYHTEALFDSNLSDKNINDNKRKRDIFEKFLIEYRNKDSISERKNSKNSNNKKTFNEQLYLNNFVNQNYYDLINYKDLIDIHNGFIYKLCQDRIENLPSDKSDDNNLTNENTTNLKDKQNKKLITTKNFENQETGYSLFVAKDDMIVEFDALHKEVNIIKRGVSEKHAKETILQHIINKNDNKEKLYLDDITVFTEVNNFEAEKEERPNSEGTSIIILTSILFIAIFFIINPQHIFYDMRTSFVEYFETNKNNLNSLEYDINNINDLRNYFNVVLDKLYDEDISKFKYGDINSAFNYANNLDTSLNKDIKDFKGDRSDYKGNSYYPLNTNYYSGMLINFKTTQFEETQDINYQTIKIRKSDLSYYGSSPYDETQDFLTYNYNSKNSLLPNSYSLYFKPNLNSVQLEWYKDQIEPIFNNKLYEFMYSILIYNIDYKCVLMYSVKITFNSFGEVSYQRYVQGFLPYLYIPNNMFFLIASIVYFIGFLYIVFLIVRKTFHLKLKDFPFEWYYWLDIIVIAISFGSQIISYTSFLFLSKHYTISIEYEDDFYFWANHSLDMRLYLRITGLAIVFICFRLIRFLYTSFPNFGVVFQTLGYAYKEILAFMTIVVSILIGISMMTHIAFGSYSSAFSTINSSLVETFLIFIGIFDYNNFYNKNYYNPIAPYFFVFFMIFMNLILINTFLCIIRNNYAEIKEKKQKINEAYNLFLKDKSEEIKEKVLNLILFKDPKYIIDNEKSKEKEIDVLFDNKYTDINEIKHMNDFKSAKISSNYSTNNNDYAKGSTYMWNSFVTNLKNLNLKSIIFGDDEESYKFEKVKFNKFKEIDRLRFLEHLDEIEVNYEKEFKDLTDTFCYICFIIVFVFMIYMQLSISVRSELEQYVLNYWKTENFNDYSDNYEALSNIKSWEDVEESLDKLIKNSYQLNTEYTCGDIYKGIPNSCISSASQGNLFNQRPDNYLYLQPPHYRLSFRFFDYSVNDNSINNQNYYVPYILSNINILDEYNCYSESEYKLDINKEITDKKNLKYSFIDFSSLDSSYCGGYIYYFNNTQPYCKEDKIHDNYCSIKKFFFNDKSPIGSIYLDSVIASLHYNFLIYTRVSYIRGLMGLVQTSIKTYSIPINQYNNSDDFNRLIVEIIYILYIVYYLQLKITNIMTILLENLKKDFYKDSLHENFEKSNYLNKYLRINFKEYENESIFKTLFSILLIFIKKILIFIFFVLHAIIKYILESFFNFIDIFSIFISILFIFKWYSIVKFSYMLNFNFIEGQTDVNKLTYSHYNNNIYIASILSNKLNKYTLWASVNGFFILIRMIQYYKFSKPIHLLICIISKAKSIITFHLIFIAIVNFGFMLYGYSLFSHNLKDYSTLSNSLLQLIIILAGKIDINKYYLGDKDWSGVFIISYSTINILVLFNVLNAIIIISYREIKLTYKSNDNNISFFKNIKNIVNENFFIFFQTSNLFYNNLLSLKKDISINCDKIIDLNEEELKKDILQGKVNITFMERIKKSNDLKKKYFNDVSFRIKNSVNLTLQNREYDNKNKSDAFSLLSNNQDKNQPFNQYNNKTIINNNINKNSEEKVTSLGYISVPIKMFLFVWHLINDKLEENEKNIKNVFIPGKSFTKNFDESEQTKNKQLVSTNKNLITEDNNYINSVNIKHKLLKGSIMSEDKLNNSDEFKVNINNSNNIDNNIWLDNFKKNFKLNFFNKRKTFFKDNLFDLNIKSLSLSNSLCNDNKLSGYNNTYQIEPVIREHYFNLNLDPPCIKCYESNLFSDEDLDFKLKNNTCINCNKAMEEYEKLYLIIYTNIIKYFYCPKDILDYDKEIYYGFYLNEFIKINKNKVEFVNFKKNLTWQKFKLFTQDILNLEIVKTDGFEENNCNNTNISNEELKNILSEITEFNSYTSKNNKKNTIENINNLLSKAYSKDKTFTELSILSKFFVVWNALYIILYKKYPDFVRRLKDRSPAKKLHNFYVNDDVNKNEYPSFYSFMFINLFDLNSSIDENNQRNKNNLMIFPNEKELEDKNKNNDNKSSDTYKLDYNKNNSEQSNSKLDVIKNTLKQAIVESLNLETKIVNSSIDVFFKDEDIYLFEENEEDLMKKITPPNYNKNANSIFAEEYYPDILITIWNKLARSYKFDLFFGYNKDVKKGIEIDCFLNADFLNSNNESNFKYKKENNNFKKNNLYNSQIDCGIYEFFTSPHRAEILKNFVFPSTFNELVKLELKNLNEELNIIDYNRINEKTDLKHILKVLSDSKLNYLKLYEFMSNIFKKYLLKPKQIINSIIKKYNNVFKVFINLNSNLLVTNDAKLSFVNFYKLMLSKDKFDQLYHHFNKKSTKSKNIKTCNKSLSEDRIENIHIEILNRYNEENKLETNKDLSLSKNKSKDNDDIDNESNNYNEYELFILSLSIGPLEYIVIYYIIYYIS